jgi:Mg-chelatase subunit ChlD
MIMGLELSGHGLHGASCRLRRLAIADNASSVVDATDNMLRGDPCSPNSISRSNSHKIFTRNICESRKECKEYTTLRNRRSVREVMKKPRIRRQHSTIEPEPLKPPPIPFDIHEHGAYYRRQQDRCGPEDTRYVLFMLDTSGSISRDEFNQMIHQLSRLTFYFCRAIKVAVMTFNHEYYIEFCFGCHESTNCSGREQLRDIMRTIQYRGGFTHTAGAAQCACNYVLSDECGFDESNACIDVVVVTDGHSNDPSLKVCEEIQCLRNASHLQNAQVNTFVMGISDEINNDEIKCIADVSIKAEDWHVFNFTDFYDFQDTLNMIITGLKNLDTSSCIDPPEVVGDTLDCRAFDNS